MEYKGSSFTTSMMDNAYIDKNISYDNTTLFNITDDPPRYMTFTDDSLVSVVTYAILMAIAIAGNLTVFVTLSRNRHRKSRVNLFIMHLCCADMIVTFVMLPMEIGWHVTVSWEAGDIGCRLLMFWRAFGFYLSSFILIAISLDRYMAVAHPLSLLNAGRRGKLMLTFAWLLSAIASAPQSVIFHQETHPNHTWFKQCVTYNFFPSPKHKLAYNLFNMCMLYILPLVVILVSYTLILVKITLKAQESHRQTKMVRLSRHQNTLRRSGIGRIEKARTRTLKMTIVIVLVFILCWTPYFMISAWWWIDEKTAKTIPPKIQRALFIFAVSNSCMNPIVYGMFTTAFQREMKKLVKLFSFCAWCRSQQEREGLVKFQRDMVHDRRPANRYDMDANHLRNRYFAEPAHKIIKQQDRCLIIHTPLVPK